MARKKYRFTVARRRALRKARRKWMRMKPKARREAMPPKKYVGMTEAEIKKLMEKKGKRYVPVGGYAWLDVGRPGYHYILVQKTKYGWKKIKGLTKREVLARELRRKRGKKRR